MKGTLSTLISILVVTLAVAAPTAVADPGLNGAPDMSATPTPDWFERAAASAEQRSAVAPYVDAFERPGTAVPASAPDWFERAATAATRDASAAPYVDAFERPVAVATPATQSTIDSGTDIAWGQIGIAFIIGLMLALGLMLAMRSRPGRAIAQ